MQYFYKIRRVWYVLFLYTYVENGNKWFGFREIVSNVCLIFVECFKGSYHLSPCNLSKESQRSEILRMLHDSPQLQCVYSNPWPSSVVSENKWNMIKLASHS